MRPEVRALEPRLKRDAYGAEVRVRADSLPNGLARGQSVMVQVDALRAGDTIATSHAIPVRLP